MKDEKYKQEKLDEIVTIANEKIKNYKKCSDNGEEIENMIISDYFAAALVLKRAGLLQLANELLRKVN